MTNGMHQRFEFIHAWRICPVKPQAPIVILHIHAVEDEHVKVQIEVQSRPKSLDQGNRAGLCRRSDKSSFID
jgi:hypothetical protein